MSYEQILTETHGRVGVVKFNRPDKRNALSAQMNAESQAAIDKFSADPDIGAVVLTGADPAFCGGADVGDWKRDLDTGTRDSERLSRARNWVEFFAQSKPVVCAINGPSIGAGMTLTLSADARIASDRARFSMRFIRMGIIPELASTKLLPLIVGFNRALELMLTGKTIDAAEAERIGLVNRTVPHERLMDEAIALAAEMAFNDAECLAVVKRLTWQHLSESDLGKIMVAEGTELRAATARPAFAEAVNAFMTKRQPDFHKKA